MTNRRYRFVSSWQVAAPPESVRDVLVDVAGYPGWWPQILAVAAGDGEARVLCRSTLPYALDLIMVPRSRELPLIEVGISGTLTGIARFRLTPAGAGTSLEFSQEVEVHGALAVASVVGRPLLRWNHARMMRGCRDGLARRLGGG